MTPAKLDLILVETVLALALERFVDRADHAAELFVSLRLEVDDVVEFHLANQLEYTKLCWVAKYAGLRYVEFVAHYNAGELACLLTDSDAWLIVSTAAFVPVARFALGSAPELDLRLSIGLTDREFQFYEICLLA